MKQTVNISPLVKRLLAIALLSIDLSAGQAAPPRVFRPEDLFRVQRVGAVAWSPDGRHAAIEFTRPGQWLSTIPNNDIALLDVRAGVIRPLSSPAPSYLGFFNATWSPDGRRVAFLSVDAKADVRLWVWTVGAVRATAVPELDVRFGLADPPIAWIDRNRLAVMAWDAGAEKNGLLHIRILRGRNGADAWKVAVDGKKAAVSVLESRGAPNTLGPSARLLALDLGSGTRKTLARGRLHRLSVSPDGCCVSFLRQDPGIPGQTVASYFERASQAGNADAGYTAVNWGTDRHTIDADSGLEIAAPPAAAVPRAADKADVPSSPPRADARLLSVAPTGAAALYLAQGPDGSRLWLSGGGGRPLTESRQVWRANTWMSEVKLGRAEHVAYTGGDGAPLNAWVLLPPDHVAGTRAPLVTIVYPTSLYGASPPSSFSAFQANFEHPQLFAALGYAVLLPSMPARKDPLESHALAPLLSSVLPAVDAAVARGLADPDRIAVAGQSDGGFATLGLITQTTRFRTAIASASFSNLVSFYGTLNGQSRHGDLARPDRTQVLRMLQFEKGGMGLGGPPWEQGTRYHENSAVLRADKVETPLMLIHGELDSVPIQQAEEFFTALFRQDKRAVLVRYAGEGHEIDGRANVLDLWRRVADWLGESMAPRR